MCGLWIQNIICSSPRRRPMLTVLHVSNHHVDVVPFLCLVPLQQNYEFMLQRAVLSQNLVARVRHLVPELPVVKRDHCVLGKGALSWSGQKKIHE